MTRLKYLILGFLCLAATGLFAEDRLIQIDTLCTGYFIDEAFPNPFSPVPDLTFGIPDSAYVTVEIHRADNNKKHNSDFEPKVIKTLIDKKLPQGMFMINWDGTDSRGIIQDKNILHVYYIKIERTPEYVHGFVKVEAVSKIVFAPNY
jgi:hypothetical protein